MKFKGFFKGYWNLCKEAFAWLKDYWFLYIVISTIISIIICFPSLVDLYRFYKPKKIDDDLDDDFLD